MSNDGLTVLQERLEDHFHDIRIRRDRLGKATPLFALEHGLSEMELQLLNLEVRAAVRRGPFPHATWLPLVVYAAEIGYDYSGDEYWATFESRTPGWTQLADRHLIRRTFRRFSDTFGGAEPSGTWASHFSIIAWPITHAVLPTDLGRQLARLLFESRTALDSELLSDPQKLGVKLAARAWHYSSRFQNFAQNTSLLGQVAAALLVGDEEESPYLTDSTLKRIVAKLSGERKALRWLRDAKATASRVRTHGLRSPDRHLTRGGLPQSRQRLPGASDPKLFLRRESEGWAVHLELPDLSVLAERMPGIQTDLGQSRARVAGVPGPPLARGRILYPGERLRLNSWPADGTPLIQLEKASDAANALLADQCTLSPGPRRLFRVVDAALAVEVRGKVVRSGLAYILVSDGIPSTSLPSWATAVDCATLGIETISLDTPPILETVHIKQLEHLGLTVVTDVEVRPAGIVAASWDGEGSAQWLAGEDPIVAVRSTRSVTACIFSVNREPHLVTWPAGAEEIFVTLTHLGIGSHDVQVTLLDADVEGPVAEGALAILVRDPQSGPSSGTFRDGLMIAANPANPTISEVWDGRAALRVIGPPGVQVSIGVALRDKASKTLNRHEFRLTIPHDATNGIRIPVPKLREDDMASHFYDYAESCIITAEHRALGIASILCEREFSPLRWVISRDRVGPLAKLINNTGTLPALERYDFAAPARRDSMDTWKGEPPPLRWSSGGLIRAVVDEFTCAAILPPLIRDHTDLRAARVNPRVPEGTRTVEGLLRLINLARMWQSATLPADPFAVVLRQTVLRAMTVRLMNLIAGQRWAHVEELVSRGDDYFTFRELEQAVGDEVHQRSLAHAIGGEQAYAWVRIETERRGETFAPLLVPYVRNTAFGAEGEHLAQILLRLSSEPGTLDNTNELRSALELAIVSPVLVRAARFIVLAVHSLAKDDDGIYQGWSWQ
ncbi:hypothetical protein [Micromonospora sp. NBC_01796]|uniref:hypothetical protein n=1 Tax=Micromonospora sp. NBC_01796 TaxID=2975987 RepID=UPI002DDB8CA4|nr:hypothetical protein [Micromonospora sp. NBC_01796]WSA87906.1 hypothetical protein OIE47_10030 [Micromonospora sp. NBC_01796]